MPDAEGQAAEAAAAAAEMEENRQRMAALKESLMSGQGGGKAVKVAKEGGVEFAMPKVEFAMPKGVEVPKVEFAMPKGVEVPKVELPKVELPKGVEVPKVELPEVDIPLPDVSGLSSNVSALKSSGGALVDREVAAVVEGIRAAGDSVLSQVPPGVREQVVRVGDLLGDSVEAYKSNPEGYSIVLGVGLGVPLLLAYNAAYGGYNGVVKPVKVMEMLQNGDAVLVDVRTPEERKQAGVPLLKLAARGKGVAVPLPALSPSVSRQVSNPRGLAVEILGQQISSISKLNPQTKVVVMDRKGEVAKDVARACRAAGVRTAYVMDGGFNGYRRQEGLAVDGRDFYEDGPLALAGDQVESLASGLKGALGDRKGAAFVLGSIAAATFVGANLHEVLKFVGVLGIEATIVLRYVLGDERIGDDLATVLDSFDGLVAGVTRGVNNSGERSDPL